MIGQPVVIVFVVISFRLFLDMFYLAFTKMKWNKDEISVLIDFIQKKMFVYFSGGSD